MDPFDPLLRTKNENVFSLIIIDHFSRWVESLALSFQITDSQFEAIVVQYFCKSVDARMIYGTPYYPQDSSIVENYMQSKKKRIAVLVSGVYLHPLLHLVINLLRMWAEGSASFFMLHGREAVLPVQRYLDEPPLDLKSKKWPSQLWKVRVHVTKSI